MNADPSSSAALQRHESTQPADPGILMRRLALIGAPGAVSLTMLDWDEGHPDENERNAYDGKWRARFGHPLYPLGVDLGVHSVLPISSSAHDCDLLPSGRCHYDGSALAAMRVISAWAAEHERDDEWLWSALEREYEAEFGRVNDERHP